MANETPPAPPTTEDERDPTPGPEAKGSPADRLAPYRHPPFSSTLQPAPVVHVSTVAREMTGAGGRTMLEVLRSVALGEIDGRTSDRIAAAVHLLDRAYGKAVDVTVSAAVAAPNLPPDALETLARELRRPPALAPRVETRVAVDPVGPDLVPPGHDPEHPPESQ